MIHSSDLSSTLTALLAPLLLGGLVLVASPRDAGAAQGASTPEQIASARARLAAEPAAAAPAMNLAKLLGEIGALEPALVAYAEARRRQPDLTDAYLLPALLLRDAGRTDKALDLVRDGLKQSPDTVALLVQRAALQLQRGNADAAAKASAQAIEMVGDAPELLQVQGLALAAIPEHRGEAAALLARSLERTDGGSDSAPPAVRTTLGELAIEAGDAAGAARYLEKAAINHPNVPAIHFRLATALRLAGRQDDAKRELQRSEELRALDDQAEASAREHGTTLNRAQQLANQNQLEAALAAIDEALEQAPESGRAWALRSKILFSTQDIAPALEAIQKARELDPARVEFHYLAGAFLRSAGERDDAREALRAALAIEPRLGEAHALLGGIALEEERLEEAANHLQTAVATGLSTGDLHAAYAQVLTALDRGPESAEQWRLAREARAREGKG